MLQCILSIVKNGELSLHLTCTLTHEWEQVLSRLTTLSHNNPVSFLDSIWRITGALYCLNVVKRFGSSILSRQGAHWVLIHSQSEQSLNGLSLYSFHHNIKLPCTDNHTQWQRPQTLPLNKLTFIKVKLSAVWVYICRCARIKVSTYRLNLS